jgi:hypothetical protein
MGAVHRATDSFLARVLANKWIHIPAPDRRFEGDKRLDKKKKHMKEKYD